MLKYLQIRVGVVLLMACLFARNGYGQTMQIIDPLSGQPACPGVPITYDVQPNSNNTSTSGCEYNWTIRGGVVFGTTQTTAISKTVTVVWNNTPPSDSNPAGLTVVVGRCNTTTLNGPVPTSGVYRVVVRSLSTTTPAAIVLSGGASPTSIAFGSTSEVTFTIPQVAFPQPNGAQWVSATCHLR